MTDAARELLLYHFCRLQLPAVRLPFGTYQKHLHRTFDLFRRKQPTATRTGYLESLYAVDWFLCAGCIERQQRAWDLLFANRTGRTDCLLIDALHQAGLQPMADQGMSRLVIGQAPARVLAALAERDEPQE